uniref:OBP47-like domain-containing protein n=1 Tax=Anopheles atroparvus TaxID=41427 RepID=A0AAG5DAS0_ANOAO
MPWQVTPKTIDMSPYVAILVAAFLGVVAGHPGGHGKCSANLTLTVDECCKIPLLANETVVDSCKKQFPFKHEHGKDGEGQHAKGHRAGACLAGCILNALGGFKDDSLDTAGFKKSLGQVFKTSTTEMSQLLRQSIDECAAQVAVDPAFLRNSGQKSDNAPACNIIPMLFMNCLYGRVFEKCPRSEWNNRKECTALKDKLKGGCPYFALRKHPKREN